MVGIQYEHLLWDISIFYCGYLYETNRIISKEERDKNIKRKRPTNFLKLSSEITFEKSHVFGHRAQILNLCTSNKHLFNVTSKQNLGKSSQPNGPLVLFVIGFLVKVWLYSFVLATNLIVILFSYWVPTLNFLVNVAECICWFCWLEYIALKKS